MTSRRTDDEAAPPMGARGSAESETPTVSVLPVAPAQRPALARLWQLYTHDLSEFRGLMPDGEGLFPAGRLPLYVEDPDRSAYLIWSGPAPSGFALVRGIHAGSRVLGEFFVVRAARGRRVGHRAALQVLAMYSGQWEIAFQEENPGAARFWRRVANDAAGTSWREERRPILGKPDVPPDTWLLLST